MSGLRPALSTFIFLLLITGGVYPLLTTVTGAMVVSLAGQWFVDS